MGITVHSSVKTSAQCAAIVKKMQNGRMNKEQDGENTMKNIKKPLH